MSFDLSDYNDVATRVAEFRSKHPEGSLQSTVLRYPGDGFGFVVVEARAYRNPEDPRPGIDVAWEPVPGRTPYTKDSELQNASTSAVGRAIVACLAADTKKGIASAEDVRNRSSEEAPARGPSSGASGDVRAKSSRPAGPSPDSSVPSTPGAEGVGTESSSGGEADMGMGKAHQVSPPDGPITAEQIVRLRAVFANDAAIRVKGKKLLGHPMPELESWTSADAFSVLLGEPADATA